MSSTEMKYTHTTLTSKQFLLSTVMTGREVRICQKREGHFRITTMTTFHREISGISLQTNNLTTGHRGTKVCLKLSLQV